MYWKITGRRGLLDRQSAIRDDFLDCLHALEIQLYNLLVKPVEKD